MRFLAICPRIRKQKGCIVATTAWRVRLLLLGLILRRVEIDPANQKIRIFSRYLWLLRFRREVSFKQISAITYGYEDMSAESAFAFAYDSWDWFTVGIRIADRHEIHLFNFVGDGSFTNNGPLPDWMYWDNYACDLSGSQDQESRVFVDLLATMIQVPVDPPRNF